MAGVDIVVCEERSGRITENVNRIERRTDKHGQEIDDIRELTREMAAMVKLQAERQEKQDGEIKELVSKPGKRWELIVTGLISTLTAMGGAAIITMIVK